VVRVALTLVLVAQDRAGMWEVMELTRTITAVQVAQAVQVARQVLTVLLAVVVAVAAVEPLASAVV
jgi:hypothetical protein